jgi:hypothetical protein
LIEPQEVLKLFIEPDKNQGLILHYAYQAMPKYAEELIKLRTVAIQARLLYEICADIPIDFPAADRFVWTMGELNDALKAAGY